MDQPGMARARRAGALGGACVASALVAAAAGVAASLAWPEGFVGLPRGFDPVTRLLTVGTTPTFALVLLVGVLLILTGPGRDRRGPSGVALATLVVAVPLGVLVAMGTGLAVWLYASPSAYAGQPSLAISLLSTRAVAAVPALFSSWLAFLAVGRALGGRAGARRLRT